MTATASVEDETPFAAELAFTVEVAERAGRLLSQRYERVERIDYKSARDVVTEVDHLSESLILGAIREAYPGDAILAEESGEHRGARRPEDALAHGRTWVVDPLDGTINYANGIPFFCVSVALTVDGRPTVAVVHDPSRGETFSAVAGTRARLDSDVIAASDKDKLSDFVVSLALGGRSAASRSRALRKAIRVPRSMGSAALALAYVGNGRFDAFVQQGGLSVWDVAAAGLIAECGGAQVTDMDGAGWFDVARKTRTIGLLAAPAAHHGAILALARG
ncbi:MAG TPA: inositol monophosphatase family protein [Candidatus Limnocylindrales bacterium]|nr:inositol monophosphatase family protein [Candidatus Limnocylindrales bacterium]